MTDSSFLLDFNGSSVSYGRKNVNEKYHKHWKPVKRGIPHFTSARRWFFMKILIENITKTRIKYKKVRLTQPV